MKLYDKRVNHLERLQKVIANAGLASRRKAEQLILDKKVKVNGKVVSELGVKVDPEKDDIRVNGQQIYINPDKLVLLFNKPKNVITTVEDPQGRKTVVDYIHLYERVYPVGRLDYETEGLLILTNDGELANRLMHPSYEINKTYEVTTKGIPTEEDIKLLRNGIPLEDGMTAPAYVKMISKEKNSAKLVITIHEGRNRQIRRMLDYIKKPVLKLTRTGYGSLTLEGVASGDYRELTKTEICNLKEMVKLNC